MSGLYVHIPFCKSRCIYCGFYSTTDNSKRAEYIDCLCDELRIRKDYLTDNVRTIYFGGGTPSLLLPEEIEKILNCIYKYYKVASGYGNEITIECNPDDITEDFSSFISSSPINRISMGAQSFSNKMLRFINRRHSSEQISEAVRRLRRAGINNISIDLMFGFPDEDIRLWTNDIAQAITLDVEHISAYSLMYEELTPLYKMLQAGKVKECDEETYILMYNMLIDELQDKGYEHYEISNFAKPGFRSKHNSSYWQGIPYIGVGASAHSFNKTSRQWNISNLKQYMEQIKKGYIPAEIEYLSKDSQFDDTVMTGLRTREGVDLAMIKDTFGEEYYTFLNNEAQKHIRRNRLAITDNRLHLTREGLFISDSIMSDLMHV